MATTVEGEAKYVQDSPGHPGGKGKARHLAGSKRGGTGYRGEGRARLNNKELTFCKLVADGESYAQAYREAYNSSGKPQSCQSGGWRLMQRDDIKQRIEHNRAMKASALHQSALSDEQRVRTKLRNWMDGIELPTSAQVRAAELLGKASGMFKDVTEVHHKRSSDDVASEIKEKLTRLMNDVYVPESERQDDQEEIQDEQEEIQDNQEHTDKQDSD